MRLLNRSYKLDIELDGDITSISGLRIAFDVKKPAGGGWSTASLKIYNAAFDTISKLESNAKMSLYAGYGGENVLLFSGTVMNSFNTMKGEIEVFASDGESESKNAHVSKTYDPSFGIVDVIKDIVGSIGGMSIGEISGLANEKIDALGGTYIGEAGRILDEMSKAIGFSWTVDNGEVTITKDLSVTSADIIEVSKETGMIGSPVIWHQGVEVRMLLNPLMLPQNRFEVVASYSSSSIQNLEYQTYAKKGSGIYTAISVTHSGDTHGKDWTTFVRGIG